MASLYFEELQIGSRSAAGPYLLSKDEIIGSQNNMIRYPATSTSKLRRVQSSGADRIGLPYLCDLHLVDGSPSTALPGPHGIGLG